MDGPSQSEFNTFASKLLEEEFRRLIKAITPGENNVYTYYVDFLNIGEEIKTYGQKMIDWIKKEKEIKLKSKDLKEDEIVVNLKPEPIFLPISKILLNGSFKLIMKRAFETFVVFIENEGRYLIRNLNLFLQICLTL